jgi:hypothetical protein
MIMTRNARLSKVALSIAMLVLASLACNLGRGPIRQEQRSTPQPGEALPPTGATQDVQTTPELAAPQATAIPTQEIGGTAELIDNLRLAGAQVELGGKIDQPMLKKYGVEGQIVQVNGVDVQVFEFGNEFTRSILSGQISEDGSTIAGQDIPWEGQPNFWAEGRIVVLYVGTDAAMIDLLSSVMGEPITTHE